EEVHGAPALGPLVGDPSLEPQPGHLLELLDRLVAQVAAELRDRRLRVGETPEDEPDDHGPYAGSGSFAISALIPRRTSTSSCPKSSRKDRRAARTSRSSSSVSSIVFMT